VELARLGGGFPINNGNDCLAIFDHFFKDEQFVQKSGETARNYVVENAGATTLVIEKAKEYL
jgi:hypothetical protein